MVWKKCRSSSPSVAGTISFQPYKPHFFSHTTQLKCAVCKNAQWRQTASCHIVNGVAQHPTREHTHIQFIFTVQALTASKCSWTVSRCEWPWTAKMCCLLCIIVLKFWGIWWENTPDRTGRSCVDRGSLRARHNVKNIQVGASRTLPTPALGNPYPFLLGILNGI